MAKAKKLKLVRKRIAKEKGKILLAKDFRDTVLAILLLTLIFAYNFQNPVGTVNSVIPALLAVGVAFFVNKIAHNLLASKFGCAAYYKLWLPGIIFGLLLMIMGFKFPVVGLIIVHPFAFGRWGFKSRRLSMMEEGLVGFIGPASNIMLAMLFSLFPGSFFSYMSFVSAYFAIFNLLPIKPLNGYRIIVWKPLAWFFLVIINVLIFFV